MYAIVEIAGLQYKVEKDQQLYVNRLKGEAGDSISFDKVLLTDNGTITVGAPVIDGLTVGAKIIEHLKADKVIVFKKKRRKGYKKKNGFRQSLTKIEITAIGNDSLSNSSSKKKSVVEKVTSSVKETAAKVEETAKAVKDKAETIINSDRLTVIEGVGPKVQELLNQHEIWTFEDVSKKSAEEIKAILEPKGGIYASMDPTTWPKQAEMAAEGKMDELKAWQDELKGGK